MRKRILFVVYTPFEGYLPKRMAELKQRVVLEGVEQIIVTPDDYTEKLKGQVADTVHLVHFQPDTTFNLEESTKFFTHLPKIVELIESIKYHNI